MTYHVTYQANGTTMDRKEAKELLGAEVFQALTQAAKKLREATGKKDFTFWKEGSLLTIRF